MTSALAMAEQDKRINWRKRAVCRTEDPELFHPVNQSGPAYDAQVAEAKAVCDRCPVRAECLSEALTNPQAETGIWGGLTEDERHKIRRRRPGADS